MHRPRAEGLLQHDKHRIVLPCEGEGPASVQRGRFQRHVFKQVYLQTGGRLESREPDGIGSGDEPVFRVDTHIEVIPPDIVARPLAPEHPPERIGAGKYRRCD